eukprot:scaffold3727_cov97-Isochrysis_galbana.AAC.3
MTARRRHIELVVAVQSRGLPGRRPAWKCVLFRDQDRRIRNRRAKRSTSALAVAAACAMPGLFFQPPPPPVIGGGRPGPVGNPNNSRLPPIAVPEQASPLLEPAACEPAPAELSSAACAVRLQRSPVLGVCMGAGDAAGEPSQPRLPGPARLSAAAQPPPAAGAVSSSPPLPPIQGPPPVMLHAPQKTSPSFMIPSPPRNRAPLRASAIFPTQPTPSLGNAFRWRMGEKHSVDRLQKVRLASGLNPNPTSDPSHGPYPGPHPNSPHFHASR